MSSHDVNYDLSAKLGEVVDSYHRVFIARQNVVQSCLVFNQIVNPGPVLKRPIHMRDKPCAHETLLPASVEDLLDQSEHPVLIEVTIP